MSMEFSKSQIALAVAAAIGATTMGTAPDAANAAKPAGKYVAGDFHNHTTCSDGSISMQKLVKKATDKVDTPWGLDWFVQAGHGGNGNRNCTLVEDATLATPAYPFLSGNTPFDVPQPPTNPSPSQYTGPNTLWAQSIGAANVKGNNGTATSAGPALSTLTNPNMWRWQSLQEFQYPVMEYLSALKGLPLFVGLESVVAGHEHSSMAVISGQMPAGYDTVPLPSSPPFTPQGNANALAQWSYCFDRNDTDWSRGNTQVGGTGNSWECSVPGSPNSTSMTLGWNTTAQKILVQSGTGSGDRGHEKTVEAMKWMREFHPEASYYVPAHLERAGPFNPNGNNGYNIENLRNFNNAAPKVAFGFETQPGHHASNTRGEYIMRRNNIGGVNIDSVGGTTYGGTGVYGAQIGGVWDALLGEGRNYWFFASSDWHNRGMFGPDDRRSTQDFYPGEYQRTYVMVRNGAAPKLRPQPIVDGLRTGNAYSTEGQLIDRLAFIACASYPGPASRSNAAVENAAVTAAQNGTDIDIAGCATMGEKLKVRPGADIVVSIVVRDPDATNYSPYTFDNPSLLQVGINQPVNAPVLDHVDVIGGLVTGYKTPGTPDYAGQWPNDWINPYISGSTPSLAMVPAAAKNTSAGIIKTYNSSTWQTVASDAQYKKMTFRIQAVTASQYVRLRGSNLPASVPWETDAEGNPLPDLYTNPSAIAATVTNGPNDDSYPANYFLKIECTTPAGTTQFNGCPSHLPVVNVPGVGSKKYVAYDVAAWTDLWFYSNPIFVEVGGSYPVAGVK